jgi:conserved oligomeric Golgi complex subunit 2
MLDNRLNTDSDVVQNFVSPHNRASTPIAATDSPSAESTIADDAILRQYAAAIVDIKAVRTNVLTVWREEISMMLPEMSDRGIDSVTSQGASKHVSSN